MVKRKDTHIPPGYKKTEVGVIPEDWEVSYIADHAFITTGTKNTQDKVDDGLYPFFVRSQKVERINTYSYEGEAVLTAGDGVGTGKVFHYINGRFDVHQRVYRISDFSEDLDGRYFFYQFSTRFYNRIVSMTAKSSVDSVRMDMIAKMPIPLPPLSEQRAIARVLSDVDGLLEALDGLIEKKRALKTAAMQQLLTGKKRLPGFEGKWVKRRLGEVAEIVMGQSPSSQYYNTEGKGIPLIQGNADLVDRRTVARIFTTQITKECYPGDIILTVRAPVGQVGKATFAGCLGRGVCAIRYPNDYLFQLLVFYEDKWAQFSKGSTFDSVNSDDVKSLELSMPSSTDEQRAIARVLSDMDAEIEALEAEREKVRQLKQGMMQVLLTGKVRLVGEKEG